MKKSIFLLIFFLFLLIPGIMAIPVKRIDVIVFHSETCSACYKIDQFLHESLKEYPIMIIQEFDITIEDAKRIYDLFKDIYDLDIEGYPVPMVIIGKDVFSGSRETTLKAMDEKLKMCFTGECTITIVGEKDIIISDSTPSPQDITPSHQYGFMVLAGVFCSLNPYTMGVATRVRKEKTHGLAFITGYGITCLLFCLALINVLFFFTGVVMEKVLAVIAGGWGVLAWLSAVVPVITIPRSYQKSMYQLITDRSQLSLFSLGIGTFIGALLFTTGIYLLIGYTIMDMSLLQRLAHVSVVAGVQVLLVSAGYTFKIKSSIILYLLVGIGSILMAVLFWMGW